MSARVHPSAIVDPQARLARGVVVGPFCRVGAKVEIGEETQLLSHVCVDGPTRIGARCEVFPFAALGGASQDRSAQAGGGELTIGDACVIRENVTVNRGNEGRQTSIGAGCLLLAGAHVAHDCRIGDGVVLSNAVLLGGHVEIGEHVMIGGGAAVHQHVRVGAQAFVGGLAGVEGDVAPFMLASGDRAHLFGVNLVGLRRRGFDETRLASLRRAYRALFLRREPAFAQRVAELRANAGADPDVARLLDFVTSAGGRPLCAPRRRQAAPA